MRELHLDFHRPLPRQRGVAAVLLVVGALALLAVVGWAGALAVEVDRLAAALDDAQRASRHERRPVKAATPDEAESTLRDVARANAVVASLNLGWGELFQQVEAVRQPGVTLLAMQPEGGNSRRWRFVGEARDLDAALAYVKHLAGSTGFANVHLVSHERASGADAQAVQFAVVGDWGGLGGSSE